MDRFKRNLKAQIEANPIVALGVTAALLTAASKLLDSNTARVSAKTHAKEVDRRVRNSQR
jgi:hypothetical protein